MARDAFHHRSPLARLVDWLALEQSDLWVLTAYIVMTILLSLAVPLAVQTLVNTIAAGVFLQPLVVTIALLLVALLFASAFKLLQFYLVEILQQRLFARIALEVAHHVPNIRSDAFHSVYGPELVNRFFDVVNIQKSLAKLLIIWPTALIQVLVGMALLVVYSPAFVFFDVALLVFVGIVFLLGHRGLRTSIKESHEKYKVAYWLQELARCHTGFKLSDLPPYLYERADDLVHGYLKARNRHFGVLLRQTTGSYLFQAIASAGLLGLGGWLVIERQLTIGQLVAAELVMVTMLVALENLVTNAAAVYDLLTGFDKVGHIVEMPLELSGKEAFVVPPALNPAATAPAGLPCPSLWLPFPGVQVDCRNLRYHYADGVMGLDGVTFRLEPGQKVALVGESGAGKSTLLQLLAGLLEPQAGTVLLDGQDLRLIQRDTLRHQIGWATQDADLFNGTLEENLRLGRDLNHSARLPEVLEAVGLMDDIEHLPDGLRSPILPAGHNLPNGFRQRVLLARMLLKRPRLLLIDEAFTGMDEASMRLVLRTVLHPGYPWTVVLVTQQPLLLAAMDRVIMLKNGRIVADGSPTVLAQHYENPINQLFPSLLQATQLCPLPPQDPSSPPDALSPRR